QRLLGGGPIGRTFTPQCTQRRQVFLLISGAKLFDDEPHGLLLFSLCADFMRAPESERQSYNERQAEPEKEANKKTAMPDVGMHANTTFFEFMFRCNAALEATSSEVEAG